MPLIDGFGVHGSSVSLSPVMVFVSVWGYDVGSMFAVRAIGQQGTRYHLSLSL